MAKAQDKQKIISIVGPTATGKTKLALKMAERLQANKEYTGVDIISADSRQVYHGFEILSGADLGDFRMMGFNWQKKAGFTYPYLAKDPISSKDLSEKMRLHGAAIIDLKTPWSLGQFHQMATEIITAAREDNRAVIVVGGTMLYHDRLLSGNDQISVPPNPELREKAAQMSVEELQIQLQKLDPTRFDQLNESDLQNSRRLVRHLEIALAKLENQVAETAAETAGTDSPGTVNAVIDQINQETLNQYDHQYYMPDFDQDELKSRIAQRVQWRFKAGAIEEVRKAMQIIGDQEEGLALPMGYHEIKSYLMGELPENEALNLWTLHEWQYAKKQIKWWQNKGLI